MNVPDLKFSKKGALLESIKKQKNLRRKKRASNKADLVCVPRETVAFFRVTLEAQLGIAPGI